MYVPLGYGRGGVQVPEGVPSFEWKAYSFVEDLSTTGGVRRVYKVKNVSTGDFFIIQKILILSDELDDEYHTARILSDMHLATSLHHPNVMKCLGVLNNEYGIHFLYNWMPHNLCRKKIRDEHELAKIAYQVLKALDYLRREKRFVFKHLTPGNFLYDQESDLVRIGDVGSVKDKYIILGCVPVKPWYMKYIAPENFHLGEDDDDVMHPERYSKSDVWSLGLCLLEFYVGAFPFDGDDRQLRKYLLATLNFEFGVLKPVECDVWPPRAPSDAPPLFRDFISSCLKLDVSRRADVDELLKHEFITTHCSVDGLDNAHPAVVSDECDCSDDLGLPICSENDAINTRRRNSD